MKRVMLSAVWAALSSHLALPADAAVGWQELPNTQLKQVSPSNNAGGI